ncbi:MAG TPA: glycosyltransferase [Puia sp.]|nr:glycosyltransferase [Puia sp.]
MTKRKLPGKGNAVFSILIPTWNNLGYLQLCIESIRRNSRFTHQLIVHINEGVDGTLDWVASQPDIDYTYSKENIGICYALNIQRSLADTDYIVYMNDDMVACPDWDLHLLNEIRAIGHNYFFVSATVIEPVPYGNDCVIVKDYGTDIKNFREKELYQEFASFSKSDWQGATWPPNVVHRDLWDLVGGYSTEFSPGMYSDPDFSMKLWKAGVRIFKGIGSSRLYHFGSKSVGRIKKNKGYYTFIAKWGMTSSTFTRGYLRRGAPFDGELSPPLLSRKLRWKNLYKRVLTAFRTLEASGMKNRHD